MALRVHEKCFWPAKIKKNLIFWRCLHFLDLVLKYCSDINKRNWLQLLFYFLFLMGLIASVFGMSFFLCFNFWVEVISYCFLRKRWKWIRKLFVYKWIDFWFSSWNMAFFIGFISVWIETCINCWNLFFLMTSSLSIIRLGDTLGYFLNVLVLFSGGVL